MDPSSRLINGGPVPIGSTMLSSATAIRAVQLAIGRHAAMAPLRRARYQLIAAAVPLQAVINAALISRPATLMPPSWRCREYEQRGILHTVGARWVRAWPATMHDRFGRARTPRRKNGSPPSGMIETRRIWHVSMPFRGRRRTPLRCGVSTVPPPPGMAASLPMRRLPFPRQAKAVRRYRSRRTKACAPV